MAARGLNRQQIETAQLVRLNLLFDTLSSGNRFYEEKLRPLNLPARFESVAQFSESVPFTTKKELSLDQLNHPPYGTNLSFPLSRFTRYSQTSGTAGSPLRWLDTPETWAWMLENWKLVFRFSGVRRSNPILFTFSFGPFLGFWTAFEAAVDLGCLCIPAGGLSSRARLQVILDNRVSVICCTPTYALRLAEVAAEEGIDLGAAEVRKILTAGEPGGCVAATRRRIEQAWKTCQVVDHHGMTEVGPVSFECPKQAGVLHVIENSYIAEIVNPENGKPAGSGQEGELVLTPLGRDGSPLLRYRTGDLVKKIERTPCVCGRFDLALDGGILGRIDEMVCIRGVNVYPAAMEQVIRSLPGIAEYQVHLDERGTLPEIRLQIEPMPSVHDPSRLAQTLAKNLRDAFTLRIPVTVASPGALPRFEMKARRWLRSDPEH